jgi:hypothetical protein
LPTPTCASFRSATEVAPIKGTPLVFGYIQHQAVTPLLHRLNFNHASKMDCNFEVILKVEMCTNSGKIKSTVDIHLLIFTF